MKKKTFFLVLMLAAIGLQAQVITGDWFGLLNVQGTQLKIIFHVEQKSGVLTATMDSPNQNAIGLPIEEASFMNNELFLNAKSMGVSYKGIANKAMDSIDGTFMQGSAKLKLMLARKEKEKKIVSRPQDPKDFPYYNEDIMFKNNSAGIELAGTLTLPKDKKASKIAILISGSGPQNRNEEVVNHRPFLVWSDWLTKQGIGVLRYDDRGVGKSTGSFSDATSADFADDAEAAVNYILSRNDLKNISIGLMGHSEGGMIAPMVAAKNKKVEFIILLAGPGVPIDQLLVQQMKDNAILEMIPDDILKLNIETTKKTLVYLKKNNNQNKEELTKGLSDLLKIELEKYPKEALNGTSTDDIIKSEVKKYTGKWYRFFGTYDPGKMLEKMTCPVLAINGILDCQVNCKNNLGAIKEALQKAKNKHFEIVPMDGLNHLFQKAETGAVTEYNKIEETVNPAALTKVSGWINNLK